MTDVPTPAPVTEKHNQSAGVNFVEYEKVSSDYLDNRRLKKGTAGWILLAGLGVSYVISGDFAGWNFGLAQGGFGGMLLATILMAVMYSFMVLGLAELSASIPTAGGGYAFARRAMGPWGGFLAGTAILLEYAIAPAAIVIFIGMYVDSLWGINGPAVYAVFYVAFVGIHLWGAGEALKIMLGITVLALIAIIVFIVAMIPQFDAANLTDIAVTSTAVGASPLLPEGYVGIWAAIPFAMWLFLAVEGVPLAAEDAIDPARDIPRGIIAAMVVLLILGGSILFLAPGGAGAGLMKHHGAPLVGALQKSYGKDSWIPTFVNVVGLAGLIASFFGIIFAYSRQVFALSRAGYLPRWLSVTGKRQIPAVALIVPGILGFLLSLTEKGDLMITMVVFGATISYILMMLSHIILRYKYPDMTRPYRTPGGVVTTGIALILAVIAFASTFIVSLEAAMWSAVFYAVMVAYFMFYSRHHLVAKSPDEEFAVISEAESELNH